MSRGVRGWLWGLAVFPGVLLAQGRYETWSLGIPQGHRGFASDPDLDLRSNGLEFVLDTQPLEAEFAANLEVGQANAGPDRFVTLTFVTSQSVFENVLVAVEACGDGATWSPVASMQPRSTWQGPGPVTTEPIPGGNRVRTIVRDAVPFRPGQPRFLRLSVALTGDRDSDGISDEYEVANGLDPDFNDAALDRDGDGLTNLTEHDLNTLANRRDSDGDGWLDGVEHASGRDPSARELEGVAKPVTKLLVHLPAR